jgi:2'-5' RNA ligase
VAGTGEDGGVRTVELIPDDALDGAVRAVWRRLAAAGLPSLATHPHPTNRPHLTVATADQLPEAPVAAALDQLPIGVRLAGVLFFDGRAGMAAWRVHADEALYRLHAQVWRALDGRERNPLHAPQAWVPHVSLARRVRPAQHAAVRDIVDAVVADGRFVAARSYDTATRAVTDLPAHHR